MDKNKIIKIIIALILPLQTSNAFFDISPQDPQLHIFSHLKDVNIMQGFADGNFYPNKQVTRAEALTIALRAGDIKIPRDFSGNNYFQDINPNNWYAPVIARGVETKIILNKHQNFRPNTPVTKAEFLAFLFRATKVNFSRHYEPHGVANDIPTTAWFAPHFSYAKKYQIAYLPTDNFYRPNKLLTRREVAMMTFRQLKIFHGDNSTKLLIELQAEIQQFISFAKENNFTKAEFHLHKILELNESLARTNNDKNANSIRSISKAMSHLSLSLRYFKNRKTLPGIEQLHLALKQAKKAESQDEKTAKFAQDISSLINETLISFATQSTSNYSLK
jgi:hypothetical protein